MKRRVFSLMLALVLALGLLPATAFAAGETVTVSIETKTIDGKYLVEPTEMTLEANDTPVSLVTRLAGQQMPVLAVENPTGTYITKIGDFGATTHGSESGWMLAINNDHTTWPQPELKVGDTVRACFTYKTYGNDIDLMDYLDELSAASTLAEKKLMENEGNPFSEPDGYLEDETSKFNILSAAYAQTVTKLAEVAAFSSNREYLDSLGMLIYGSGSETETVRELIRSVNTAISAEAYVKATGANITAVGNSGKYLVGSSYTFKGEVLPANATDKTFTWAVNSITGEGTIDQTGRLTITKAGMIQVRLNHQDTQVGYALQQILITAADPTPAESLDIALEAIAAKNTAKLDNWWWAVGMSDYAAYNPSTDHKATDAAKQAFVDSIVADMVKNKTKSNNLANAINGLSALGYDPTKVTAADGAVYDAVGLLTQVDAEAEEKGSWSYFTIPGYVLLACNQGNYATDKLEKEAIRFLLDNTEETGGWSTTWGVDSTAMTLQGLAPYYNTNAEVKTAADKAVTVLAGKRQASGCMGNASSDAMVVLAMAGLGISLDDPRFVKDGKTMADELMSHYSAGSFGGNYFDNQGFLAAVAAAEMMGGKTSYNAFDFSETAKTPAVATPEQGGGDNPGGDPNPPVGETMDVSFTLKTHNETWIPKYTLTVAKEASVGDAFKTALKDRDGFSYVDNSGYISSVTHNGATWAEFTAGPNSGWKYMVNGVASAVGMNSKTLSAGDDVVWYYVTDYTQDTDRDEKPITKPTEPPKTETEGGETVIKVTPPATADKNGTAKAEVSEKDMTNALTSAKKEKAAALVITPEIKGEAKTVTVALPIKSLAAVAKENIPMKVDAGIAAITLPAKALTALGGESGKSVSVTAKTTEAGVVLEIAADGKALAAIDGGVSVALPAEKAGPGTVLVLVAEDGTETVLKKSLADGESVTGLLAGSATVKVVDNTKSFADVPESHWGAEAMIFAAGHELLGGTGDGQFSPAAPTDRAMVMTVLCRLSGECVEAEGEWYAPGMAWAKKNGVSDGTDPAGTVTREALAAMLYRAAGSPETDGKPDAADGSSVSGWAESAMAWAMESGILTGDQTGSVNPQGSASRAETAVMLQRYVEYLVK